MPSLANGSILRICASVILLAALMCDSPSPVQAQESGGKLDTPAAVAQTTAQPESVEDPARQESGFRIKTIQRTGTAEIGGHSIAYQVETGTLTQSTDTQQEKAEVFFVAYTLPGQSGPRRPVTFAFNGGPGSSSVWLHLGMLGPERIELPDDASLLQPPYQLSANPHSLLDITDLVFIDPVSTGFSRPIGDEKKSQFHGFDEDVRSVAQFIHDWTSHYQRWDSPLFLMGESYGGLRAAGLSSYLQSRYNLELNGIAVISGAINFQTLRFDSGNDLPYLCFLPTYAATAWYHGRLSEELQSLPVEDVVAQAEAVATGDYAQVLLLGSAAPAEQVDRLVEQLSRLTGIDAAFWRNSNLRVSQPRFCKELLRGQARTVGRFDSRYSGIDRDAAGDRPDYDPSGAAIFGPFTATLNQYLRQRLGYQQPRTYEILTGNVQPWNYDGFVGRYVDASDSLRRAMTANPHLQLYVACGYYDLATPHFAMQYTLNHLGLDPALESNVTVSHFEGGHMMYIFEPAMVQLRSELLDWYQRAMGEP